MAFANARREKGLRAKNGKSSHLGSISGAPSEAGPGSSGRRCSNGAGEVVVVVQRCVRKREAGKGAEGQKCEIEPFRLDFGRAVGSGGGKQ